MSRPPKAPQHFDAPWELADASALQALCKGTANADQQIRAIEWIVKNASKAYDVTFMDSGDRQSAFSEGRRYVGLKIIELTKINIPLIKGASNATKQTKP